MEDDDSPQDEQRRANAPSRHPLADLVRDETLAGVGKGLATGIIAGLFVAAQGGVQWLISHLSQWFESLSGGPPNGH